MKRHMMLIHYSNEIEKAYIKASRSYILIRPSTEQDSDSTPVVEDIVKNIVQVTPSLITTPEEELNEIDQEANNYLKDSITIFESKGSAASKEVELLKWK